MPRSLCATVAVAALLTGPQTGAPALAQSPGYQVEILAEGLNRPWGMAFLPNGRDIVMTARGGTLSIWRADTGAITTIDGAPDVAAAGQGGLLDIALAPGFADTGTVFLTWSGAVAGGTTTHLGRATLDPDAATLRDIEVLLRVRPAIDSPAHYGARIVIHDGHVFMGTGDRNSKAFGPDHIAQDVSSENGAVVRLALDGSVPGDNPLVGRDGAAPAIWSWGHRNIQAMAVRPGTDEVWLAEHGESGGDEINRVVRGGNFGWPLASYGVDYRTGQPFADPHRPGDGFVAPLYHWGPGRDDNFPPSGMAWVTGEAFAQWEGHLLVGNLRHRYLGLFPVDGDTVSDPIRLLEGRGWRIRDVAVGPADGFIYVLADGEGAPLLRLVPSDG
ncbi:PQQ-dependent sugar dehydrogenase [Rhodobaculum claviforme]|uniref:Glucose dehydrogenase n=1 Tax=Rhodobaculum claviforme TaxID=1549854 RepID=A0A934TJS5_9RHOB|nr:PQQ-dependent sugar dehydrogenase [Rhodobaculum claviforme]MBK5927070.1 glucose dehydrogenase [Rhodobaculum claviforme]